MTRTVVPVISQPFTASLPLSDQFHHLYFTRYSELAALLKNRPPFDEPECEDILRSNGAKVWFIGTVFCHMQSKPNIIKDISLINHGEFPKHAPTYTGPGNKCFIEPKIGRPIPIAGKIDSLVTGTVVAVRGHLADGEFIVEHVHSPGFESPSPAPKQRGKIFFISGLNLETTMYNPQVSLLLDYFSGYLGDTSSASQLVICGNSLKEPPPELVGSRITRPVLGSAAIFDFVKLIQGLCCDLPVHLMPGETDPAPVALPQRPFHKGLFAGVKDMIAMDALHLHSNPTSFRTEAGVEFLGTSGQPITDLLKYDPAVAPIDLLCRTLEWRHMAPTAPNTLPTYPYSSSDPLIIQRVPHVYFAGNMPEYASTVFKGVRVVCVPSFSETGQIVELDLNTLETRTVKFANTN